MGRFIGIGKASQALGVSISTLRRWKGEDKILSEHTVVNHHHYDLSKLRPELFHSRELLQKNIAYARVSSHDQKDD
nr:hypothetical protein [Bartonella grahamii]